MAISKKSLELLALIVTAANSGAFHYVNEADAAELLKAELVEVNKTAPNAEGLFPSRPTTKGLEMVPATTETASTAAAPAETGFQIFNAEPPKVTRNSGKSSKYPLDKLTVGQGIFVVDDGSVKQLNKSLGGLISQKNKDAIKDGTDVFFVVRTISDGKDYGQPGKKGVGIFRRPVSERPAPKAPKAAPAS